MKKLILLFVILVSVSACTPDPVQTDVKSDVIDKGDVRPPGSQN
jgi:hypothetical protein